jgi:MFS family permease
MDVTTAHNRGRWTGLYQTWFFLGAALGAFVGGLLTDWIGYTTTMWIGATLTACGGAVAFFLLPETRLTRHNRETRLSEENPVSSITERNRPRTDRGLWVAASLQGINRFVIAGVLYATMGLLVQDRLHTTGLGLGVATLTGALVAGRTLFSMAAAPLAGTLSDRAQSRRRVIAWGLGLGAVSMVLVSWNLPVAILVGITLGAVTSSSVQAMVITLAGDLADEVRRGRAIGLIYTVGDLGSAVGPPVAYALLPGIGLGGVYLLCAGLFVGGLLLTSATRRAIK